MHNLFGRPAALPALLVLGVMSTACTDASPMGIDSGQNGLTFSIVSGNEQTGPIGTELPDPLVVRVVDEQGLPVAGQIVNFVVVKGGGSVFAGQSLTNQEGMAQEWWTLGGEPGENVLEVRAVSSETGERLVFGRFTATGISGSGPMGLIVSGNAQQAPAGSELPEPLVIRVVNERGEPISGQMLNFVIVQGGGSVYAGRAVTNRDGLAQEWWTLGPDAGENILEVRAVDSTTGEGRVFGRFTATGVAN